MSTIHLAIWYIKCKDQGQVEKESHKRSLPDMCPKHILDMSGLNTRNEQLDSRVTEREKFHDGWDLNLIWFDYYYILISLLHIILNKIEDAPHFMTWPRLRCILTWNQDRLQLPIPCSIGSQGEFGWRSNEEQSRLSWFAPTDSNNLTFARMCLLSFILQHVTHII